MNRLKLESLAALLVITPVLFSAGCAKKGNGGGNGSTGGGSTVTYPDSTGNWVVQATATSGMAPFSQLSGYINEQRVGSTNPTTGTFLPASGGCYAGTDNIPMQGVIQGLRLHLVSFGLDQQVLDISAAKDTTSSHFTGTYSVTGGCANGAAGTVTATRYNALTGTYKGTITASNPAQNITLTLTQFSQGTGDAKFLLNGSASFVGVPCFTSGTLSTPNGTVVGGHAQMHFVSAQGSTMDIAGDFDPGATTLTVTSIVPGGSGCPSNLGQATLTKA